MHSTIKNETLNYRADIDGMRAIAVISVIGFHAFPSILTGGFIGVDVFFVISGYLISNIILSGLNTGNFSFSGFYTRRIKRIFPALILVLMTCYLMGWVVMYLGEQKQLAKHIVGSVGFISNFILMGEPVGYFDNEAITKPLQHLWSLAIEEQFYIIWPFLLVMAYKKRYNLLYVTISIAVISFLLNLFFVDYMPVITFYLPVTRFWEFLIGAVITLFPIYRLTLLRVQNVSILLEIESVIGAVCLILSIFLITKEMEFPGWLALLPTVGTAMLISAGEYTFINRRLLSHPLLVWLGLISYPLYLWHWPLLSFAHTMIGHTPLLTIRIIVVLLSVILAWLTYKLVERPVRYSKNSKRTVMCLCFIMATIGSIGYYTFIENGITFLIPKERSDFEHYFENSYPQQNYYKHQDIFDLYRMDCNFYIITNGYKTHISPKCYTPHTKQSVFIWGNSHAEHLYYGLSRALPPNISILQVIAAGCIPSIKTPSAKMVARDRSRLCNSTNHFALEKITEYKPDIVILAQDVNHQYQDFEEMAQYLKSLGVKHVVLVGPVPHWERDLYGIISMYFWPDVPKRISTYLDWREFITNKILKDRYSNSANLTFVSALDFFCNRDGCITYFDNDKKTGLTTYDHGHLAPLASEKLGREVLAPVILKLLHQ